MFIDHLHHLHHLHLHHLQPLHHLHHLHHFHPLHHLHHFHPLHHLLHLHHLHLFSLRLCLCLCLCVCLCLCLSLSLFLFLSPSLFLHLWNLFFFKIMSPLSGQPSSSFLNLRGFFLGCVCHHLGFFGAILGHVGTTFVGCEVPCWASVGCVVFLLFCLLSFTSFSHRFLLRNLPIPFRI